MWVGGLVESQFLKCTMYCTIRHGGQDVPSIIRGFGQEVSNKKEMTLKTYCLPSLLSTLHLLH
jgi:hypothetical protein